MTNLALMNPSLDSLQLTQEQKTSLERWCDALKIPSISADPQHRDSCIQQAHWFQNLLQEHQMESQLWYPSGNGLPAVFAQNQHKVGRPTILFYGHYDVQPVDPLDLWETPPFEPTLIIGDEGPSLRARGANDDKGQLLTFLEAAFMLQNQDKLDVNLKIFLEGEEESGSPSLEEILQTHQKDLQCDVIIVSDVDMWTPSQPSIITSLRGQMGIELTLTGPQRDLHSGLFGGMAVNPAQILSKILADMFDENHHIQIEGFYEGVHETPQQQKQQWEKLNTHMLSSLKTVGLNHAHGEKPYLAIEQNWSRPTLDITGLTSGYQGEGHKTIIPSKASVKISCRLVHNQDPHKIYDALIAFVQERLPQDCTLSTGNDKFGRPYHLHPDNPYLQRIQQTLSRVFNEECLLIGCGASIPAALPLSEITKAPVILGGWGQGSDSIHAPNENYSLRRFFKGIEAWKEVLKDLQHHPA